LVPSSDWLNGRLPASGEPPDLTWLSVTGIEGARAMTVIGIDAHLLAGGRLGHRD